MPVFITDHPVSYDSHQGEKVLVSKDRILLCNFWNEEEINQLQAGLNGFENKSAEIAIKELEKLCSEKNWFKSNKSVIGIDFNTNYSILYNYFKLEVAASIYLEFLLLEIIQKLGLNTFISLKLSAIHQRIEENGQFRNYSITFYEKPAVKNFFALKKRIKKAAQLFKKQIRVSERKSKHRIVLFYFNIPSEADLFDHLLGLINKQNDIELILVECESWVSTENSKSLKRFSSDRVDFYKLEQFKLDFQQSMGYSSYKQALAGLPKKYSHFDSSNKYTKEIYEAYFANVMAETNPDLVWYCNTGEVGRYLADVCRSKKITVANIDYALFSDDYLHMASRIRFDYRFCIGEHTKNIWLSKNDPTPNHEIIGFLKLDQLQHLDVINQKDNAIKRLVFFSTWGGTNTVYNVEKLEIVCDLISFCEEHDFELLIKLHPAEHTNSYNLILAERSNAKVKVIQHGELSTAAIMRHSTAAITQNSSIAAEAMIFNVPTVYFNAADPENVKSIIGLNNEFFVFFVQNIEQFGRIVFEEIPKLNDEIFESRQGYYLFKVDGKSSERLIEKSTEIILRQI